MKFDKQFYTKKSWGSKAITEAKDLPTLKLRHALHLLQGKKGKLLEVGCGSGRILASIKKHTDLKLTGIDLDEDQIKLAKKENKGITFIAGNGEQLPFKKGTFDYVVFFDFIEHVEHPEKALKEMARVLKPGGQLYGVSPAEGQSIYKLSSITFGRHFKEQTAGHIQQYTRKGLKKKIEEQGFAVEDVKYSYHLVGSLMDYTLFTLMLHPTLEKMYWEKNQYYKHDAKQTLPSKAFNLMLKTGNTIAYYESSFLQDVPLTATAIHVTATK